MDREWRKAIIARVGCIVGLDAPWFDEDEPLVMAARFYFQRPKTHFVANDRGRGLNKSAPAVGDFTRKPDLDNLEKSVADALQGSTAFPNGLLYGDDQQISTLLARKLWAGDKKEPGCDLIVCRVGDASGDVWAWLMA